MLCQAANSLTKDHCVDFKGVETVFPHAAEDKQLVRETHTFMSASPFTSLTKPLLVRMDYSLVTPHNLQLIQVNSALHPLHRAQIQQKQIIQKCLALTVLIRTTEHD